MTDVQSVLVAGGDVSPASGVLRDQGTLGAPGHDDDPMARPWTENDVLRVLWSHFVGQWAPIPQATVNLADLDPEQARRDLAGGGIPSPSMRAEYADRRIDMLLARSPRRTGVGDVETLAVEVKVTRADFLNDVRHPEKQAPWRRAATRHAYAVPAGLVHKDEIPAGSGLIVVKHGTHGHGSAEWALRAPYKTGHHPPLPARVHVTLAHRLAALEARTRGWTHHTPADDPQDLRAALVAAQKDADRAHRALDRERGKADAWRTAYALAAADGLPCRWCRNPVRPLNPSSGWFKKWRHVNGTHDAECAELETQALENRALDEYEAADDETRRWRLRAAQRWSFAPLLETEPWRAFLPVNHLKPGTLHLVGPTPAEDPTGVQ